MILGTLYATYACMYNLRRLCSNCIVFHLLNLSFLSYYPSLIVIVKHHEAETISIKITVDHIALVLRRPQRITAHLKL